MTRVSARLLIHKFSLVVLLFAVTLTSATAFAIGDGSWKKGKFEVYVFDVGQADSQLIVGPSGKTLLIDLGEHSWRSATNAKMVGKRIREIMGSDFKHIDYVLATHLHLDHTGYVGYGGLWNIIEKQGFSIGKLIDRDAGVWVDKDEDGECDPETEIEWHNAGTLSGTSKKWICYATDPAKRNNLHREIAIIGSDDQIKLGKDVTVTVVEADAKDVYMADRQNTVQGDHTGDKNPPSENDYSIGIKVAYKNLTYYTSGDTDGQYASSSYGYVYNDVETIAAPKIGKVDIMHVNHHGSAHSSNQKYVDTLHPQVSIISCGPNSYGHPDQATLNRLTDVGRVYITEECDPERIYNKSSIVNGDVVISSKDGTHYTVNKKRYEVVVQQAILH